MFETLDLNEWKEQTPHIAILLDDAINILKDNKFKQLRDLLTTQINNIHLCSRCFWNFCTI
jgi:hypothetical protein